MEVRKPAVAGQFYPSSPVRIEESFRRYLREEKSRIDLTLANTNIIGGVVPHAGYAYSGHHAIHFFEILARSGQVIDTVVIINPNHAGYGPAIALDTHDAWATPLGHVMLDKEMMQLLPFPAASVAHDYEHSGEVMVPFLQYFIRKEFMILPVTLGSQTMGSARELASAIHEAVMKLNRRIVVIASSDFSHFLSPEEGCRMDQFVLDQILRMDTEGVARQVSNHDVTVCGFGTIMALMEYSSLVSSEPKVKVLSRGHSGEVAPSMNVVNYITILFYQDK